MAEITRRKTTTYRWICVDKDRCEELDEQLDQLVYHQSKLSSYVESHEITGLECLVIENKFKWAIKELRDERKTLWRRVPKVTEEEIVTATPKAEALLEYTSPFAPPNMERVL